MFMRPWPWFLALAGALFLFVAAAAAGWPEPIVATDLDQHRFDVALPPPAAGTAIAQTFRAGRAGLQEIELRLAESGETAAPGATLTAQLLDDGGRQVAERRWQNAELQDGGPLLFSFAPQSRSAGRTYTLVLRGSEGNGYSVWGYSLDVLEHGALAVSGAETEAQTLRLVTRYRLTWPAALRHLGRTLGEEGFLLLLALALLPLPGALLLLMAAPRLPRLDAAAWWGLALALGVAAWPLLWFWLTLAGGHWTSWLLALLLVAGWGGVLWLGRARGRGRRGPWRPAHAALLLLLLLALAVRLLAVRDLFFPPWVDAARHALITEVMATSGRAPRDYAPFLPVDTFPYHFGFHTLAAGLRLLQERPLPRLLLILGQLLNALVPLSLYTAGWLLARRRAAGLAAAFLVAIPFLFPAYYATWGRLTQITGVVVLPPLLALTWLLLRGARGWRRAWWLLALLAAGLFLIHLRVFLVYLPFAALAWLVARGRGSVRLLAAAALSLLLVAPRLWQLLPQAASTGLLAAPASGYNAFPTSYVRAGWEWLFVALVAPALLWAVLAARRRRRRALLLAALAGWAALVVLLLTAVLPATWLVNLNSAYILFFVPLALLLAIAGAAAISALSASGLWCRGRLLPAVATVTAGAVIAALFLFGVRQQVDILNPATILAAPQDWDGLRWVEANLPAEATVAVNAWQWLGTTWAGSDGGAWLLPLTGRRSTTPPVDYIYDHNLFFRVLAFNEAASNVGAWSAPANAAWLRRQGVTHIFVGARGGFFDPAALARNPAVTMLYGRDGVFVFALK